MDGLLIQLPSVDPTTKWLLVIASILTILYAVVRPALRSGGNKGRRDPLARAPLRPGLANERAVERDMNNLMVELSEMARQITGQLDTRAAKLELLIKEADQRLAALEQATRNAAQRAQISAVSLPVDVSVQAPAPVVGPVVDPRHAEVYALADDGHAAPEIARKLARPRGEVELILALRDRSADR